MSKINYISFSLKLNEKKKVLLKNVVWRGWVTKKIVGVGLYL